MNQAQTGQEIKYDNQLHHEPQDLGELRDIALAQNPFATLRMLYRCPPYALLAFGCFYAGNDLASGRFTYDLGEALHPVTFTVYFLAFIFGLLTAMNWVGSYMNLNLVSQWFTLFGTASVVIFCRTPELPYMTLLGQMTAATLGSFVFELVAILWLVRRRDTERIHRLKQLSQLLGIISALAVIGWITIKSRS